MPRGRTHLRPLFVVATLAALLFGVGCLDILPAMGRRCDLSVPGLGCLEDYSCISGYCVPPTDYVDEDAGTGSNGGNGGLDASTTPDSGVLDGSVPVADGGTDAGGVLFTETFEGFAVGAWPAGSQQGRWTVLSGGTVQIVTTGATKSLRLEAPINDNDQAAERARSAVNANQQAVELDATAKVSLSPISAANRGGELRWRYRGPSHYYYLSFERVVATAAIHLELGANGQNGQAINVPSVAAGATVVRMRHVGNQITVFLNGNLVWTVNEPSAALDGGTFGLAGFGTDTTVDELTVSSP
ncbi:MAG: hypothetical protein ACT4TC_08960 [Myxococcaceae bacterium]